MRQRLVDCLLGLQWGSEGKGKIAAYLSTEYNAMVRSGGPQAGHTFFHEGRQYVNRQVPCGIINPDCLLYLSANSLVNIDVLAGELRRYRIYPNRLMIDAHAMVVTEEHSRMEEAAGLRAAIGSTLEGVGAAQSEKVWRRGKLFDYYAFEDPELFFFCGDTAKALHMQIARGHTIMLEGTQGFGLCLNHGGYPFVTSRDVTAAAMLADAGIPSAYHGQTIGVMRSYPIRVAGNSGPAGSAELTWDEITRRSGSKSGIVEYTTVTKRIRKVFEQDYGLLEKAVMINKPSQIALTFIDYINAGDYGKASYRDLSSKSKAYIAELEKRLGVPVTLISTGHGEGHIIDRRKARQIRVPFEGNSREDLPVGMWPVSIYGAPWDSGFIEDFIDRKMADENGNPWKRRIFMNA